jgi:hypothetical protein
MSKNKNGGDRVIKIRLTAKEFDALEYIKVVYGGTGFSNEQIAKNIILNHVSLALKEIQEKLKNKGAELDAATANRNPQPTSPEDRNAGDVSAYEVARQKNGLSNQDGNTKATKAGE